MALRELLDALRLQASEGRAEVLARADAEAARIRADAYASLEHRRREYIGRTRREEEEAARRARSRAEKEAMESVLSARERLLARVAAGVEARVDRAVADPEYVATLPDDVRAGLERLPAGPVVVRARPELIGVARDALAGRADVTFEPAPDLGAGFTALAARVGVEVDGTLATRLRHAWPRLAVSVLREVTS